MRTWNLVLTGDGSPTLVHPRHGEACHSRAGAWTESRERYAVACRVRERALDLAARGERVFRLLDVGTGLGFNLAAALEALDGTGLALEAVSLELERDVLARTLELARSGELYAAAPRSTLARFHAPVAEALARALELATTPAAGASSAPASAADPAGAPFGSGAHPCAAASAPGRLVLLLGDGRRTLPAFDRGWRCDAVFLDPFSPQVDASLWDAAFLAEVARRMQPHAVLSTYSSSLRVRVALAAAGLAVAPGGRVGTKASGTLASPRALSAHFDARTARRIAARVLGILDADDKIERSEREPVD